MGKWTCKIESYYGAIGCTDPLYDDFAQDMESCCPMEHMEETGITDCNQCNYYNPDGWPDEKEVDSNAECSSNSGPACG